MIKDIKKFAHDVLVSKYNLDERLANDWQFLKRLQELVNEKSYFSDTFIGLGEGTLRFNEDGSIVYETDVALEVGKGHHYYTYKELHTFVEDVYYVQRKEIHQLDEDIRPGDFTVHPGGKWSYEQEILSAYYGGICEAQYNAITPRKELNHDADISRCPDVGDSDILRLPLFFQDLRYCENKKERLEAANLQSLCLSSRDQLVEAVNCRYIGLDSGEVKEITGKRLLGTKNGLSTFDLKNSTTFVNELSRYDIQMALLHELGSEFDLSPKSVIDNEARVNVILTMIGRVRRIIPLGKFREMITTKYADGMLFRDVSGTDYRYTIVGNNLVTVNPQGQIFTLR